jgi:hypothetical protein
MMFVAACAATDNQDPTVDRVAPRVTLAADKKAADSVIAFSVDVTENAGIAGVQVGASGGVTLTFDTTFHSASQKFTRAFTFSVPRSTRPGTNVNVFAVARDGAGNLSDTTRLLLTVGNLAPPTVQVVTPAPATAVVTGKSLVMTFAAKALLKIRWVGYTTSGAYVSHDSTEFKSNPMLDSLSVTDTLALPDTVKPGVLVVTPFVIDSIGQRVAGSPVSYAVQTPSTATTIPVVETGIYPRIEVTDTVHVQADDPAGIAALGFEVRTLTGQLLSADSVISSGKLTSLVSTFRFTVPATAVTTKVIVQGFARNAAGTRAYTRAAGGGVRADTSLVVAGVTRALPSGGTIADAIYLTRYDRLYLSNIERNQLEVFSLTDSSFKSPVVVGSRPWGLALWPRDRNGTPGDTLLVANSGGTSVSYVDLKNGSVGREVYRYALPNIVAYTITTEKTSAGVEVQQRTAYDFSDRPQYLATTCVGDPNSSTACGDVVLVYSTTPTPGQTLPFANRGTVRWENLMQESSHFFFEQAVGQSAKRADTLEVIRLAANGIGSDSVLVPAKQMIMTGTDTIRVSTTVEVEKLAFRDTTFVRNSGDFRRAVVGEGGPVLGSRAMMFDVTKGLDSLVIDSQGLFFYRLMVPLVDKGISRSVDVSDFIANTFARVSGVGINFDGELAAIRGDSTYLIDPTIRLQGLLASNGGAGGFDFHPNNRGRNSSPLSTRLAFASSAQPVIDIFDTYCYQRVTQVPVRDPIVGPIRAALSPGGKIVLIGATVRGVVIVTLPDNFSTGCP